MRHAYRLRAIVGLAHHFELGVELEERAQPLPHDFVVLGNQDAYSHTPSVSHTEAVSINQAVCLGGVSVRFPVRPQLHALGMQLAADPSSYSVPLTRL
jgi:hypothetical protein